MEGLVFRAATPPSPKYENVTELVVDDDGTSITFLRLGRSGEWVFEYRDATGVLKFRFTARRNKSQAERWAPAEDYWDVYVTVWSLVPAILSHPELDTEALVPSILTKISNAFLAWPTDPYINTVSARSVTFVEMDKGQSLRDCLETARKARAAPSPR
jgi:hypothetical protein